MAKSFLSLCSLFVTVLFINGEDSLYKGQTLVKGDYRRSNNGVFQLYMQHDGNLVLYCDGSRVNWASNTNGTAIKGGLYFHHDGNLVIYSFNGKPVWASHTDHTDAHELRVQDDGNLVLYGYGKVHWASDTVSRCGRQTSSRRVSFCYFCDKHIFTMFILMTHNSYALPEKVGSPNQNYGVGKQFRDGIRGFNFDIYWENGEVVMMHNEDSWHKTVDYATSVAEIVTEMDKPQYRNEFVLVQFEDYVGSAHIDKVLAPWGNKVITNFNPMIKLGDYINAGKRVLLTSKYRWPSKGMHYYEDLITENNYKWYSAFENVDFGLLRGPANSDTSAKMMNHFCGTWPGAGSMVSSAIVNTKSRMLYDARIFKKQYYAKDNINIIMIDYYDTGNVFDAQRSIRSGDYNSGCWSNGALCGIGSTCFECCNKHEYWHSKAFTACGEEPCWGDGSLCGIGTSCNQCCNGHKYWYGKAMTACGQEPCWGYGTRCLAGTSCNACCNGYSWHWGIWFTACD